MTKNFLFPALLAILLVAITIAGVIMVQNLATERPYSGVLLETGDFYIGKLSRFPGWKMTDVHMVQQTPDPEDPEANQLTLVPLREGAIWGPSVLRINPDAVVFWGKVGRESQVMQTINNN